MKLYEIASEVLEVLHALENDEEADYTDTLEALGMEFEQKADNVACYIKQIKAEAEAIKEEEKKLAERRKSKEKEAERLEAYLYHHMQLVGLNKIESSRNVLQIKKTPASVVVGPAFVEWAKANNAELLRYTEPSADKTAIKKLLQAGEVVEGAELVAGSKLVVK